MRRSLSPASLVVAALAASLLTAGCVASKDYQAKVEQLDQCKLQLTKTEGDLNTAQHDLDTANASLQACTSSGQSLKGQLTQTSGTLQATQSELDQLRQQQQAAEKRLAEYKRLAAQLKKLTDAGTVSVRIRRGKMIVNLPASVLFDSGSAVVKKEGKDTLVQVARALREMDERDFLIAGHTDNQPLVKTKEFASNWELSTARAVSVEKILEDAGLDPHHLAAAGYSQYDPIATNATEDGRAENRRIEIVIMPNLNELPQLPDDMGGAKTAGAK